MGRAGGGLWQQADFLKLWAGETISVFGSQITLLALPLTAALTLQASAGEMGLLMAAETAPFLLVGLPAGVWVDRRRRRPILIWGNLGRALLLLLIPLAAMLGGLRIELLYAVAFLTGVLTVFFDVAYQAYLPALVGRAQLVEGNSKLETSRSLAQIAGPGLGGVLVQAITGPLAIVVDAASFLVSAACLALIRTAEPAPAPAGERRGLLREVGEGLAVVLGNPLLRAIAGCTATWNLFSNVIFAVLVLWATRDLGLEAAALGLVFAAQGVSALAGALLAAPIARRLGVGPTIVAAPVLGTLGSLLLALAGGSPLLATALLTGAMLIGGLVGTVYNITQVSLRQAITPDRLQGRMNATMRFIVWGTLPLGALLGGALGEWLGLRPALLIGAAGVPLAALWVWRSPLPRLREQSSAVSDQPSAISRQQ